MSQENVEIVRRSVEAWNQRDQAMWIGFLSRDAELDWSRSRAPFKGVYRGRGEHEDFWNFFWSTFADVHIETHDITDAGCEIVLWNTAHMRGRDGIEVVASSALVNRVQNAEFTLLRLFQERDEALEAVGLSERNVELLRSLYEAFNRGDFETVVRGLHSDFEFSRVGVESPVRGPEAMRAWMEPDAIEDQRFEPLDFTVNGNRVLVRQHVTGRGAGSGIEVDAVSLAVFTMDEAGLVTRLQGFQAYEEAEALEAAGLSE